MQMNDIAAVVVTYNRKALLEKCIGCLCTQTQVCDIVVIDNASSDGTQALVKDFCHRYHQISYYNTGKNLGGAGGFNYGMRKAVEKGYEYVWVMDDDCLPQEDALQQLMKADEELGGAENYGWLSSQCLWTDGQLCKMNIQRKTPYHDIDGFNSAKVPAQMATFVSLFVPAAHIKKYGLPIKDFFIWTDDWEFTRRISRDMPCYVLRDSKVVHAMKANVGSNVALDNWEKANRYGLSFRNEGYVFRREGIGGILYYLAKCIYNTLKILVLAKDNKGKRCATVLKGMWRGLSFNPKIETNL